ncbi:uncharacterized protein IWZ02DRAFT_301586 [Phyllosticta citriasiana]|uniref:Uncharacterized protein n=1 Tax=Phyllosticta citriasiana TaxID=595635 RepID=A0ABR1KKX5_9PEZI
MKSHKGLRKKLKKLTGSGAASRGEADTVEHSPSKKSDSTPKYSPALPTEAAGDVSHPSPNRIPRDDNAATLPPQEHMSPPTNAFNSASSGLAISSEGNPSASTYMTPRSPNEFLDIQLGKKDVRTFDSTAPGEATPSSTSQRGPHHTMRQSYEPLVSSNSPTQDTDVVEHPFKVYYQSSRPAFGGGVIHEWKKWECCHCGSVTHYENRVCSRLACCHKRCEAHCTTLEASNC